MSEEFICETCGISEHDEQEKKEEVKNEQLSNKVAELNMFILQLHLEKEILAVSI